MRRIFSGKDSDKNKGEKNRKEIEAEAFTQMRKAKAAIDPGVLAKVRAAIQNSPMANKLMGNVALKETEVKAKPSAPTTAEPASTAKSFKQHVVEPQPDLGKTPQKAPELGAAQRKEALAKKEKALLAAKQAHAGVKETEPVDQGKMLDIVAKMIELNPHKAGLKEGVKDILKGK